MPEFHIVSGENAFVTKQTPDGRVKVTLVKKDEGTDSSDWYLERMYSELCSFILEDEQVAHRLVIALYGTENFFRPDHKNAIGYSAI